MNYYEILGVEETASLEEIKNAHKNLVKKYHPDIYDGDKAFAEEKTAEINLAFSVLEDEKEREKYDIKNHLGKYKEEVRTETDEEEIKGFYNSRIFVDIKNSLKRRKEIKKQKKAERKIINAEYKKLKKEKKLNKNNLNNKINNNSNNAGNPINKGEEILNNEIINNKNKQNKENKLLKKLIILIILLLILLGIILIMF